MLELTPTKTEVVEAKDSYGNVWTRVISALGWECNWCTLPKMIVYYNGNDVACLECVTFHLPGGYTIVS